MLTPNDISSKKFEKSAFGYKPEDVDNFLSEVLNSYSAVYAEKEAAEEKLEVLNKGRGMPEFALNNLKENRRYLEEKLGRNIYDYFDKVDMGYLIKEDKKEDVKNTKFAEMIKQKFMNKR